MNATTMIFTMWIGSFDYHGTFIGMAVASVPACAGVASVRPTIDAEYEVIADETVDQ